MAESPSGQSQGLNFYQDHLDRVSRSFAFCIKQLKGDFRLQVGLSYLVFRILDTIEDVAWVDFATQKRAFDSFNRFMLETDWTDDDVKTWVSTFPTEVPEGEKVLLDDAHLVFRDVHNQPDTVRRHIQNCSINMARGMEFYCGRNEAAPLKLKNIKDVNRYCFFVAGIVGELLQGLFNHNYPENAQIEGLQKAFHFGLFLQKINILKDQLEDEKQGRYLVPERELIKSSLLENSKQALDYIVSLPKEAVSYRLFCAWSLFIGLASIPFIEKSFNTKKFIKLPRIKAHLLIEKIRGLAQNNEALDGLFVELIEKSDLDKSENVLDQKSVEEFPEFNSLYSGQLSMREIKQLGLV